MRSLFGNLHTPSSFSPLSGQPPGRQAGGSGLFWLLVCLLAGWLQAAALAWPLRGWSPPGIMPGEPSGALQIVSLALLVAALRHVHQVRQGVWRAWVFATSWLVSTFWWLFVSLHTYGGLPAWMAALAVFALAGLLALYYALAGGLLCALAPRSRARQALMFAALWTLAELMRGRWLTGFPWGAGGYAQVDLMAAWAPWVGVYGMGALAALLAYALAAAAGMLMSGVRDALSAPSRQPGAPSSMRGFFQPGRGSAVYQAPLVGLALAALLASLVWGGAWRHLGQRDTQAHGELRVWLLQGNIAQDEKFEPGTGMAQALRWYPEQMAEAAAAARANGATGPQLVVAPETALPLLPEQLGEAFWQPLLHNLSQPGSSLGALLGLPLGNPERGYTNSAWGLTPASAAAARPEGFFRYDKHHLVPFGEFIPPLFRWFTDLMRIPLGDFRRGALAQPTWAWAGQRIAPNICYEDLFGEELAASFQNPETAPTVLVNLSNIAWFGDTVAIDQHLQASRLRALELGRPMLRATNTGATAVINHRGEITHRLPRLTRDRLEARVEGRSGTTPYARWAGRWGLWPAWSLCLATVLLAARVRRRGGRVHRA